MVKGTQKQMVTIKTADSHYFEEIYLVVREGYRPRESAESMMAEANRILDECQLMPQPVRRRRLPSFGFFCGALLGGGLVALIFLALWLL